MEQELTIDEWRQKFWDEGDFDTKMNVYGLFLEEGDFEKYQPNCYEISNSIKFKKERLEQLRKLIRQRWIYNRYTDLFSKEWYVLSDLESYLYFEFFKLQCELTDNKELKDLCKFMLKKINVSDETGELTYDFKHFPSLEKLQEVNR